MKRTIFFISLILCTLSSYSTELTTFNIGLAHTYVPYALERLPVIKQELRESNSDILCLQEVWRSDDRDSIIEALADEYPYQYFENIEQQFASKKPICKIRNLFGKNKFVTCTLKKCKDLEGDEFTRCVINKCQDSLNRLKNENRECAASLMAQVGKSSFKSIWAVINPFRRATMFSYGGGNGLLILSKKKISLAQTLDFSDISTLNRRQALYASIEGVGGVLCTHLTANLIDDAPYAGQFGSWDEENYEQSKRLMDFANSIEGPAFIMGDFNTGVAGYDPLFDLEIFEEMAASYGLIESYGFENHYLSTNPGCTYCSINNINSTSESTLIDHILTKEVQVVKSQRRFTSMHLIEINGEQKKLYPSDHFGISIEIR